MAKGKEYDVVNCDATDIELVEFLEAGNKIEDYKPVEVVVEEEPEDIQEKKPLNHDESEAIINE